MSEQVTSSFGHRLIREGTFDKSGTKLGPISQIFSLNKTFAYVWNCQPSYRRSHIPSDLRNHRSDPFPYQNKLIALIRGHFVRVTLLEYSQC